MIIKITNLQVGIHALRFDKSVNELQLGEPFIDNLTLDCKLDKSEHQIVIKCNLTIFTHLNCDRCNIDFDQKLNTSFTLLYLFNNKDINENDTNVKYLSAGADKIDLTEDVIDFARLSIPLKKICSNECKGLCVKCGTNLNDKECKCIIENNDPVWDSLMKLKDKLN